MSEQLKDGLCASHYAERQAKREACYHCESDDDMRGRDERLYSGRVHSVARELFARRILGTADGYSNGTREAEFIASYADCPGIAKSCATRAMILVSEVDRELAAVLESARARFIESANPKE